MEITDEQVLAQLKVRRVRLKMELERVNIAIKAFDNIGVINMLDALPHMTEDLDIDEDLLVNTLMYNSRMTAEKKVMFVLSKIGAGDAGDIADYLMRIDAYIKNPIPIYHRITHVASKMFKAGKIMAERRGKKNVYTLLKD